MKGSLASPIRTSHCLCPELWRDARSAADLLRPKELDCDVILAAQALDAGAIGPTETQAISPLCHRSHCGKSQSPDVLRRPRSDHRSLFTIPCEFGSSSRSQHRILAPLSEVRRCWG